MLKPGLAARRLAVQLVEKVLKKGEPLDDDFAADLEPRDRAFAVALTSATLRHKGQLEAAVAAFLDKPLPKSAGPARLILLTGAAQLLVLATPAHAAIDQQVSLAREDKNARHFAGLINAVLRKISTGGQSPFDAAADANTPAWLMERWTRTYGPETAKAIAAAHLIPPCTDLSVASAPAQWAARLGAELLPGGSLRLKDAGRIEDLDGFSEGQWWVQDQAAAIPARLLGDVSGKRILDLCAAPGGKTAQLAAEGALVTAVDASAQRMRRLEQNLARLNLKAETRVMNVLDLAAGQTFDGALLDAPCSATGTIRRHPDLPWLKTAGHIEDLAKLQSRLLRHAAALVKPGGLLIYCVCSLEPEEGPARIDAILAEDLGLSRLPIAANEIEGGARLLSAHGDLRTLPHHGMDGFYAARLIRSAS